MTGVRRVSLHRKTTPMHTLTRQKERREEREKKGREEEKGGERKGKSDVYYRRCGRSKMLSHDVQGEEKRRKEEKEQKKKKRKKGKKGGKEKRKKRGDVSRGAEYRILLSTYKSQR